MKYVYSPRTLLKECCWCSRSQELGVLKGQLSRWLLPYNADTSVDEQQAATPRRFQEALQKSIAAASTAEGGLLTEEEAEYLTAGARKVRQLVRKSTRCSSNNEETMLSKRERWDIQNDTIFKR